MGKHFGSTIVLILGIVGFAGGLTQLTDMIVGGPALILGALAYRSCKKRKLSEVDNTTLRLVLEITGLASIVLLIGLQNDLRNRIVQEPVPNLIIPLCVILAYAIVTLRKFPKVETKALEPKLIDPPAGTVVKPSKENAAIWYIAARGSEAGPFSKYVVQEYLASGELSLDDGCWREGFPDWLPLGRTLEFATRSPGPQPNQSAQDPLPRNEGSLFEREQKEAPISPIHADLLIQKYKPDETIHRIEKRNYFARHWRGELSLAKSYWLNTYGFTLVIAILSVGLGSSDIAQYPRLISSLAISLWLLVAITQVWLTVGIYRSARVYSATYPKKKGWGGAAILLTTLGLISSVVVFATQGIPQIRGYAEIISAASQVKNYSVKLLGDLTKIELRGNLDFGVSADVEAMLNDYPAVKVLYLNSIGGRLAEADKLKDLVLQHNLDTYVVSECHSACVTVFVAGRNRLISKTALIGLHEPYFPGLDIRELEVAKEGAKKFFYSRGIDGAVIEKGFDVSYESIWNPEHALLFSSRIATGYASDEDVALGKASPADNIADLGKALVVSPNDSVLYNNRGLAYNEQGEYDRAIADLNKALELNPKFEAAYYNRGLANYNKGSYERAIADFDKAIEINPANAVAYNNRGLVYNDMGDYDRAIVDLDKSIELDPNYATSLYNRGLAFSNKGQYDHSIADLNKVIELNPTMAIAFHSRGSAYNSKGDYDRAIADFGKCIELNPRDAIAYNNRGLSYINNGEYDRAIVDLDKSIELDPNYASSRNNRGLAYANKGENDLAIEDLDKAIELDPKLAIAFYNRGSAYDSKGNYDHAISDYNNSIKLNPNDPVAHNNRGLSYASKGSYERAIIDLEKAVEIDPYYAVVYYNLGYVYERLSNHQKAKENFQHVLKLHTSGALKNDAEKALKDLEAATQ